MQKISLFGMLVILGLLLCIAIKLPSPYYAKQAMVVTEQQVASQIGLNILKAGGNAVDAAVAVGYALAVVNPCCGNIGGGGFMTIHLANGNNIAINFREKAPLRATKNMYLDATGNIIPNASTNGYLAVAVPGTVLGLETALERYGSMQRAQVMAPAIKLAEEGYRVTSFDAKWLNEYAGTFKTQPNITAIFFKSDSKPYQAGDLLIQKNLAATLKLIANEGPEAFYHGSIAHEIVAASQLHGGILTLEDFARYNVEIFNPVFCHYRGYTVISSPPPSSGGTTLCEMLTLLNNFSPLELNPANIIETMRYGFYDRDTKLGDPNFINNPLQQLLSSDYTQKIYKKIIAAPYNKINAQSAKEHEQTDTTHISIVDKFGNAVAMTYTLNGFFGAKVIAGNTGFFLNDEMDDFTAKVGVANNFNLQQSGNNAIAPLKRPLSSMAPTIVLKDGKLVMVLGSPGGPRIITAVLLTILNVLDRGMEIQQAVNLPRYHFQGSPAAIDIEPFAFSTFNQWQLNYFGYQTVIRQPWGAVEAITIDPNTGAIAGANDIRRPSGAALGY